MIIIVFIMRQNDFYHYFLGSSNVISTESKNRFVKKGWGSEVWVTNNDQYCLKILVLNPNSRGSLHFHKDKHETWYVNKGTLTVESINTETGKQDTTIFNTGESIIVCPLTPHRLINASDTDICEIIEASTTHRDEDSYRISPGDSQTKNN